MSAIARAALLILGLFLPFNLLSSIPSLGDEEKRFGWSASQQFDSDGMRMVIQRTMRHGYTHGVQTGDVLLSINGEPATEASIARVRRAAAAGDTLAMRVERLGQEFELRVPVVGHSVSYTGYFWYRFFVGIAGWILGMSLLLRSDAKPNVLPLSAALLLLIPVTISSGVDGEGWVATLFRSGWQLQAAAYRFAFPALLIHFLVATAGRPRVLQRRRIWLVIYGILVLTLAIVTQGFQAPMAWGQFGFQRDVRTFVGLGFEVLAIAVAWSVARTTPKLPLSVQWLGYSAIVVGATGALRTLLVLALGEPAVPEFFWRLHGLMLILVPATAAAYLAVPEETLEGGWAERRRLTSWITVILTGIYGLVITGAAAVVLSSIGGRPSDAEWLLFATIFLAALIFSPVLRWSQELVDRRMFSTWIDLEASAQTINQRLAAELEPSRIGARVERELPQLLGVTNASLVLNEELVREWKLEDHAGFDVVPLARLEADIERTRETVRTMMVPITRPNGTLMGAIRMQMDTELDAPRYAVCGHLAQGIASALRNAESYLKLHHAQQDLAEAERVAALGALAGGLAHEIKNPLAGLKMGLYLIEKDGVDAQKLQRIHRDLRRIDDLVTGLLRYTHEDSLEQPASIDLRTVLTECVADLRPSADDRDVAIREWHTADDMRVSAGRSQLRLLVSNLLQNALDATVPGGTVEIVSTAHGSDVVFTVRDSGPGIPEGLEARIFEFSFSTKSKGTGLGLALARREAERMGGRIEVESSRGEGSLLRVVLPRLR